MNYTNYIDYLQTLNPIQFLQLQAGRGGPLINYKSFYAHKNSDNRTLNWYFIQFIVEKRTGKRIRSVANVYTQSLTTGNAV